MGGGAIIDRHINWKSKRLWVPIQAMGLDNTGTADTSIAEGTPTVEAHSGTIEVTTIPMTTADEVEFVMPIPWDMDRVGDVAARLYFIHASTDAGDKPVYKVAYKFYGKQAQTVECKGGKDKEVTITHGGTSSTDDSLEVTPWTDMDWKSYIDVNDMLVAVNIELDALGTASGDECGLLGIEFAYTIKACNLSKTGVSNLIDANSI